MYVKLLLYSLMFFIFKVKTYLVKLEQESSRALSFLEVYHILIIIEYLLLMTLFLWKGEGNRHYFRGM